MSATIELIAAGMDRAARSVAMALLDARLDSSGADPLYGLLHDALNHMAAVRLLAELTIAESEAEALVGSAA